MFICVSITLLPTILSGLLAEDSGLLCSISDPVTEMNLLMVIAFVSKELPGGLSHDTCILVSFLIMEGKALVASYNCKETMSKHKSKYGKPRSQSFTGK